MKLFQSPSALTNKLKNDQISERDHFHFLTGFLILYGLVAQPALLNAVSYLRASPLYGILNILTFFISFWELKTCFTINHKGDRRNFLSRYTCLGFAVSIRYFAIFYLSYIVLWGIAYLPFMASHYGLVRFLSALLPLLTSYGIYLKMRSLFESFAEDAVTS